MDGDEEIAAHRRLWPRRQAADIAVKIDFTYAQLALAQARRQHAGKIQVERKLTAPAGTGRAAILAAMADIDGDQRRRGECYGGQQKKGKNRKEIHAPIIPGIGSSS